MNSFEELREAVEANQNVFSIRMESLRDVLGVKRLGVHVCTEISKKLSGVGLGHIPAELEPDGWLNVRLFKLGTPMAELLIAANSPGETEDQTLRAVVENDAAETIDRVRALVCA